MQPRNLLKEPLLHFLAIGAALFLWFQWSGTGSGPASTRIVLSTGQIEHLAAGYTKAWRRPPTEAELKGLIDDWVREEIAVREAMAAGLDRDDTVIRRRLRQKLEFLQEDAADTAAPTDAQLQAWLDANATAFRTEPRVSFRQVYFSKDKRGRSAEADALAALAQLAKAGTEAMADKLGDATMLPPEFDGAARGDVVKTFGEDFAARIDNAEAGGWTGPIASAYGLHLVLVRGRTPGELPPLAAIRSSVERQYAADRRASQLAAMYERLLSRYTVVIERREPAPAAGKGGS
jgi:hypothetical protein